MMAVWPFDRREEPNVAKRAFRYHRVSESKQSKEDRYSLQEQEELTTTRCKQRGYVVVGNCREVHTGAELDQRPEMSKLREMIRRRELDVIVCISLDRLSRSQNHQEVLAYECAKYGVQIELVNEQFEDTPIGRHLRNIKGLFAEMELEQLRERTRRGIRGRIRQGKMMPGNRPLYGYAWADPSKSRYIVNPETSKIVLRIFAEAASGKPLKRIAIDLTGDGIPSPSDQWRKQQGQPTLDEVWQKSAISRMLENPAYYGQHSALRFRTGKRKTFDELGEPVYHLTRQERDPADGERVMLPDACPALIDEATAQAIRDRLKFNQANAARNNKRPHSTLLRGGFVKCGECGTPLRVVYGFSKRDRTYTVPVYRSFPHKHDGQPCGNLTNIAAGAIDPMVWDEVMRYIKDPTLLHETVERRLNESAADVSSSLKKVIRDLDRQQANLSRAIALVGENEAMQPLVLELEAVAKRKADAERDLRSQEHQEAEKQAMLSRLKDIEAWCQAADHAEFTYDDKRLILHAFGVWVAVWPSDHKPRYVIHFDTLEQRDCVPPVKPEGHAARVLEYARKH